jgi:hypothetical protein
MHTPQTQPTKTWLRALVALAIGFLVMGATAAVSHAQQPWETAAGRACFEQWIAEATERLNAHSGDAEFNSRKPWRFNEYGLLVGRGAYSNYAPDDWGRCSGNRYCYMWSLLDYTRGFGPRWPVWQAASNPPLWIPPLQSFVQECIGRNVPPTLTPPTGGNVPPTSTAPTGYTPRAGYACYGGADYPPAWRGEASCRSFGCFFGRFSLDACLALGAQKGAREVHHGNPGGGRANECWLLNSCADLRPNSDFVVYRSGGVTPVPPPISSYTKIGAFACYGSADYPPAWSGEASCRSFGCFFGRLSLDACLTLGAQKGAREVHHGNPGGGRANECWLLNSCADRRPNGDFSVFRR